MLGLAGLVAIVMSLGMAPAIVYLRGQYKLTERRLELEDPDDRPTTARAFIAQAFAS